MIASHLHVADTASTKCNLSKTILSYQEALLNDEVYNTSGSSPHVSPYLHSQENGLGLRDEAVSAITSNLLPNLKKDVHIYIKSEVENHVKVFVQGSLEHHQRKMSEEEEQSKNYWHRMEQTIKNGEVRTEQLEKSYLKLAMKEELA